MNKLSKRAISIIVIATFLISMIPIMPAHAAITINLSVSSEQVGETVTVTGAPGQGTSGSPIEIYWDTAIGTGAILLNSTTVKADGSFEVDFDVPEATTGAHYIWAKDTSGPVYGNEQIDVLPELSLDPDAGLEDDEITVSGTGYGEDEDIEIYWGTSPVVLNEEDDASAVWVTDTHLGADAVELSADTDATIYTHADVVIPGSDLADDVFANLGTPNSFDYQTTSGDTYGPHVAYYVTDGTYIAEITQITNTVLSTTWATLDIDAASFFWFGNAPQLSGISQGIGTLNPLSTFIGLLPSSYIITRVQIEEGWWSAGSGTARVDNFEFDGVAYDFERPIVSDTADEVGSWSATFEVPTATYADYIVSGIDTALTMTWDTFTLGVSITLSEDEGPTGTVFTIDGRGWTDTSVITLEIPGPVLLETLDGDPIIVESDGTFSAEVVMPGVASTGDYTITAKESLSSDEASEDFEVDGIPKITLSPGFGPPGTTITIEGWNFTQDAGTEVSIDFGTLIDFATIDTDSNGEFSGTLTAQALAPSPPDWDIVATDEFGINDDAEFRLGMMVIIVSPTSGPSGDYVYLTGSGFEPSGDWNATLDGELIASGTATALGNIASYFYVPSMEAGTYTIEVLDIDSEIYLSSLFTNTANTYLTIDPGTAPTEYNVSISGYNYADSIGAVTFELYNSTEDWTLEVWEDSGATVPAANDITGNTTGWFLVPSDASNGDYTINVTGPEELFAQISFSVVAARVDVAPRKALFDRGDTVSFIISNDFVLDDSYIEVYSPDDTLWWITEPFGDGTPNDNVWNLNLNDLYTVPNYLQTANGNQMELASDAPLGTWTFFFYDNGDDELMNGTFGVGASTAAQIDAMMEDVQDDIANLASDIASDLAGITDDLEDDVAALSDEIGDVASDMDNLRDEIVGDLADDIAKATDAGQSALNAVEDLAGSMSDLGDAVGDIADIAGDAAEAAQYAADAADDAVTAAEDAGKAAQGLTTLVYGAIGASLIAALAAIVSLMQISKKIAG